MYAQDVSCPSFWHKIHASSGGDYPGNMASGLIPALCHHHEAKTRKNPSNIPVFAFLFYTLLYIHPAGHPEQSHLLEGG